MNVFKYEERGITTREVNIDVSRKKWYVYGNRGCLLLEIKKWF